MKSEVNFIHMLQNIACLKIVAHVSESHEIALLMEFLNGETMQSNKNQQRNGMRKISRKELLVYITHLNTTLKRFSTLTFTPDTKTSFTIKKTG